MQPAIPFAPIAPDTRTVGRIGATIDAVTTAHARKVDAGKGYDVMVEKAEPEFREMAQSFRALHARHADVIARILADIGACAPTSATSTKVSTAE